MQSIKELGSVASAGTIITTLSTATPDGYIEMTGQTLRSDVYPDLFNAISGSSIYRVNRGSYYEFTLPDFRGKFLRQYGNNSGPLGVVQNELVRAHQHVAAWGENSGDYGFGFSTLGGGHWGSSRSDWDNYYFLTNDGASYIANQTWVGGENRPTNVAVRFLLKY